MDVIDVMGRIEISLLKIFEIIFVIEVIFVQINLLVLNVVVEVVWVGEVGKGFVVVVLEVRMLV